MKLYWIKTHPLIKRLFPKYIWHGDAAGKSVYLTFDDGPVPEVTEWVLDQLEMYNAKATFFCIGNNVSLNPDVFRKVRNAGHAIGNHTYDHLNGWKSTHDDYVENVRQCSEILRSNGCNTSLFRPPYAKISRKQAATLLAEGKKIVMWDVLSADFDQSITPEQCAENVIRNLSPGSIVIFHDSVKAFENLKVALPRTLEFLQKNGFEFRKLD